MRRCADISRTGMSIVEFLGCLTAMVGGVLLGSLYLGVDLKRMSLAVLKQANVIDSGPTIEPAAGEAEPTEATAVRVPIDAGRTAAAPLSTPSNDATHQPTAGKTPAASEPPIAVEQAATETPAAAAAQLLASLPPREDLIALTDDQRATLTRAYWLALDECMHDEVENRLASIRADGNWQLFDYLTCRKQGHERAAMFIKQLNLRGVDPHVSSFAKTALGWHKDGITLFSRALDLLTDAPTAQLSGPFAQSWQSAATQHQMEERLVKEKHQAVQDYLDHAQAVSKASASPAAPASATVTVTAGPPAT